MWRSFSEHIFKDNRSGSLGCSLLTHPSLQSQGPSKTAQAPQNCQILTHPSLQSEIPPSLRLTLEIWPVDSEAIEEYGFFPLSGGSSCGIESNIPDGTRPIASGSASGWAYNPHPFSFYVFAMPLSWLSDMRRSCTQSDSCALGWVQRHHLSKSKTVFP